jgi:WD40 repeat protein
MLGQIIKGRYRIVEILGSGGYCKTYLAQDISHPQPTACVIKHLISASDHTSNSLSSLRRLFTREAAALEKLGTYPQVPQLLDHFESDQQFYLVQEYIAGQDLSKILKPGVRWTQSQVIELLQEVLSILEVVHAQGLIHRDIKPSNLIRRDKDGRIVLIDFGSVKQTWTQVVTAQGQTNANYALGVPATVAIGTHGYMPSEQSRGRPRPNSDIYALGMIGIQALTGLQPTMLLEDADSGEVIWQHHCQVGPLGAILHRMVRYHFNERYQTATQVLTALQPLVAQYAPQSATVASLPSTPIQQPLPAKSSPTSKISIQHKAALWMGMAIGVTSALGLIIGSYYALRPLEATTSRSIPKSQVAQAMPDSADAAIVHTLNGHSGTVWAVAISRDGRTLVSGSGDKTLKLWDLDTGHLLRTLSGNSDEVLSVAIGADGQTLTSGSYADKQAIKIWNLRNEERHSIVSGNPSKVWSVAISPDGKTLASSSGDESIKVWDMQTGTLRRNLSGHSDTVWTIALSPDGQTLASGSTDQTIKIWNLQTGMLQRTLSGHSGRVRSVAISSDGKTLVSGSWDKTIKIWNLQTGQLLHTLSGHSGYVNSVAIAPDNQLIASGSDDRTVKLWNLNTGELLLNLPGHSDNVNSVSFNNAGKVLVSGSGDKTIKIWQLQSVKTVANQQY